MPSEIDLNFFSVYEFNNYSLNGAVKAPLFYYSSLRPAVECPGDKFRCFES